MRLSNAFNALPNIEFRAIPTKVVATCALSALVSYKCSELATRFFALISSQKRKSNHQIKQRRKIVAVFVVPTLISSIFFLGAKYILRANILKSHFAAILTLSAGAGFLAYTTNKPMPPKSSAKPMPPKTDAKAPSLELTQKELPPHLDALRQTLSKYQPTMLGVETSIRDRDAAPQEERADKVETVKSKKVAADPVYLEMQKAIEKAYPKGITSLLAKTLMRPRHMRILVLNYKNSPLALEGLAKILSNKSLVHNLLKMLSFSLLQRVLSAPPRSEELRSDTALMWDLNLVWNSLNVCKSKIKPFPAGDLTQVELNLAIINAQKDGANVELAVTNLLKEKGITNPDLNMKMDTLIPWVRDYSKDCAAGTKAFLKSIGIESLDQLENPQLKPMLEGIAQSKKLSYEQFIQEIKITVNYENSLQPEETLRGRISFVMAQDKKLKSQLKDSDVEEEKQWLEGFSIRRDPLDYVNNKYHLDMRYLTEEEDSSLKTLFPKGIDSWVQAILDGCRQPMVQACLRSILSDPDSEKNFSEAIKSAADLLNLRDNLGKNLLMSGKPDSFKSGDAWAHRLYTILINHHEHFFEKQELD